MTDNERIVALELRCVALERTIDGFIQFIEKVQPMHQEWKEGTGKFAASSDPGPTPRRHLTYEIVHTVQREHAENPKESIRALGRRLGLPESSIRSCLKMSDRRLRELKRKDMAAADKAYKLTGGNA
ncbi:TPA: hypothetical protein RMT71_003171 [Escherichia coli]|nr:hypothetical protein [Escherichia coli]